MSTASSEKTCFISSPAAQRLVALRDSLEAHGFRVLIPQELTVGSDWASETRKQLGRADLVIGVLTTDRQSQWVLFELGQASALGRRILLIAPPDTGPIPFDLQQFIVLRIEPGNREAIDFALDQLSSVPRENETRIERSQPNLPGIGALADELLEELKRENAARNPPALERIVATALRHASVDVVVEAQDSDGGRDLGVDFAVWSDVLESFVGNPLLIEVKSALRSSSDVRRVFEQLRRYAAQSGARWSLLLFADGPPMESAVWRDCPSNVLVLPVSELLELLRTRSLPEIIRDLRNERVHGVRRP